jgi:hypothetical protein
MLGPVVLPSASLGAGGIGSGGLTTGSLGSAGLFSIILISTGFGAFGFVSATIAGRLGGYFVMGDLGSCWSSCGVEMGFGSLLP